MKKLLFTAAALVSTAVFTNVNAQTALDEVVTMNASAKVLKQIVLVNEQNVNFGAVASTTMPYLSPIDPTGASSQVPGLATARATVGRVEIDATFQEVLSLTYPVEVTLTNNDVTPAATIKYVPQLGVQNGDFSAPTVGTAVIVGSVSALAAGDVTSTTTANLGMGGAAKNYVQIQRTGSAPAFIEKSTLFFGGWLINATVTPVQGTAPVAGTDALPSTLASGTYNGNFTVTVDYVL